MVRPGESLIAGLDLPLSGARLKIEGCVEEFKLNFVPDSPCRVGCPAGVNVKAYVGLIARGNFERALAVVRQRNPLPGICGRVCTHPCEAECRRAEIDEPVAIRQLKRFIADYALHAAPAELPPDTPKRPEKIAVIGSGPAGLTAASDLRRMGYAVTIFEAQNKAGGMLVWGIPPFRLPRNVIEEEINSILNLGIELIVNTRIDDPRQLRKDGYAAVFWAPGCQQSIKLGLPFEDNLEGVIDSLSFLKMAYEGKIGSLIGRVLVIGGGDSAIDSARVAKRLGASEVVIVYRRTRTEMPAAKEEISAAEEEGVRFEFLIQPVGFLHHNGKITGLRVVRCQLAEPDASGRRKPVPIPDSDLLMEAEWVITALGQKPALPVSGFPEWVVVGGDAVGGPATVINAIASGHKGASLIHQFITAASSGPGTEIKEMEVAPTVLKAVALTRTKARVLPVYARRGFEEIEAAFTPAEARQEAGRCLRCGPCQECVLCSYTCPKHQVVLKLEDVNKPIYLRIHGQNEILFETERRVFIQIPGRVEEITGFIQALVVKIEPELCRGCGRCIAVCPHEALTLKEWRPGIEVAQVDRQRCRGCGVCIAVCPSGALQGSAGFAGGEDD
uniref:4Fe-4S dicluster domain-containing protein n=1 Tax=candidate division WOR-3 bacterium TaxID=2052148 RepID=A0A7V3PU53_UNCW3